MLAAAIVGLIVLFGGIFLYTKEGKEVSSREKLVGSLDNGLTVFFAFFISIWSTLFQEFWARKNAILAHNWDLRNIPQDVEVRPDFYGTYVRTSPVTGKKELYYSPALKRSKTLASVLVVAVSALIVFASIFVTVVLRVILEDKFATAVPFVQLAFIIIFSLLYGRVAVSLTDWGK
jgi:cytochrome bd-type quinol oxidase subunit 2